MGRTITLAASDGHRLNAYRADPAPPARAGLVVIHEAYGLNAHIRDVCDGYAEDGYLVIAPSLYDRVESGVELGYDAASYARARELRPKIGWDDGLLDIAAAVQEAGGPTKTGVIGFCFGGSMAWLAATRLQVACAVSYYGVQIHNFHEEEPACPVMLHFGESDPGTPRENIDAISAEHPDIPVHLYNAGHGFNCDARDEYHGESAGIARTRTLAFFEQYVG